MKKFVIFLLLCVLVSVSLSSVERLRFPVESRKFYYWNYMVDTGDTMTGKLIITSTTQQLELEYDSSNQADFTVGSGGDLTLTASGGDIGFGNENLLTTGTLGAGVITGTSFITGGDIGVAADANLLQLAANALTVDGTLGVGAITSTGNLDVTGTIAASSYIYTDAYVRVKDPLSVNYLTIGPLGGVAYTGARSLTAELNNANRVIYFSGNPTLADWFDQDVQIAASPTFVDLTLTGGLTVDTTTLVVDDTNDRVGVGVAPAVRLDVKTVDSAEASITAANTNTAFRIHDPADGVGSRWGISWLGDTDGSKLLAAIEPSVVGGWDTHLNFYTRQGGTLTNALHLDESGNAGINTIIPATKLQVVGTSRFGDQATNYLAMSATGVVTMEGTAKRDLTLRPDLDFSTITAQGKPTRITYGAYQGYSLPLYAADEELFFNINVPGRWDGASDITLDVLVCLSQIEDLNDDFNLQCSWANSEIGEPILNTTTDVPVETNLLTGRLAAYDTYEVKFTIDYDADAGNHIVSHDDLALRLRRLAVAGVEITGEVIVLDYHLHFTVDKAFKAPD